MATAESRPFLTPRASSIEVEVLAKEPQVSLDEISNHWQPGESITLIVRASISDKFWVDTYIGQTEDIELVAVATCPAARTQWMSRAIFDISDNHGTAELELTIDGDTAAVLAKVDTWITGPGRTSHSENATIHARAKLWQLEKTININLVETPGLFPVGAFSFEANHRRQIPWELEIDESAEPATNISSCMRLYLNSDLPNANAIGLDKLDENHMALINCDLIFNTLRQLERVRLGTGEEEIVAAADTHPESLAAFGFALAEKIGLPPFEAMRQSSEDPMSLILTCREALTYLHNEV